jgi:hypothetical protein
MVVSIGVAVVTGVPSSSTETQIAVGSARGKRSKGMAATAARRHAVERRDACILVVDVLARVGGLERRIAPLERREEGSQNSIGELGGERSWIRLSDVVPGYMGVRGAWHDPRLGDAEK